MTRPLLRRSLLLFFAVLASLSEPTLAQPPQTIPHWSAVIGEVQQKLRSQFGISRIFIGGGSSRAFLDHLYYGSPLEMRDLDIFVVADRRVDRGFAEQIGKALESENLGRYSAKDLRPRPRANTIAGYGFFLLNGPAVIDLSIFHSMKALRLNGILDVDQIMIELRHPESLTDWAQNPSAVLDDRFDGYLHWVQKHPSIVHWMNIESDPLLTAIRVVRALSKAHALLNDQDRAKLQSLIKSSRVKSRLQMVRNLAKLLEDPTSAEELEQILQLGVIAAWSKELDKVVRASPRNEKFASGIEQIQKWVRDIPPEHRKLLIGDVATVNEEIGARMRKEAVLDAMNAPVSPQERKKILSALGIKKIGYYTGEFAPFHNGHFGVANQALNEGRLDFLFLLPVPHAKNDPKVPSFSPDEWKERQKFAEIATRRDSRILVWPGTDAVGEEMYRGETTLTDLLQDLEARLADHAPLTHVAGMDSLHRLLAQKFHLTDPRPRLIIRRPGVPVPSLSSKKAQLTVLDSPTETPISASYILSEVAAGLSPENVDAQVLTEVISTKRYQEITDDLRVKADDLQSALRFSSFPSKPTFIFDPAPNRNGHYNGTADRPSSRHRRLFDQLRKKYAAPVLIFVPLESNTGGVIEAWKAFAKLYPNVNWSSDYSNISKKNRIRVIHSGIANAWFKDGSLQQKIRAGQNVVVYETSDVPLDPLIRASSIDMITDQDLRCDEMFSDQSA